MENDLFKQMAERLDNLSAAGNLRQLPGDAECRYDLSSNDYMALAGSTFVGRMSYSGGEMTASASRLLAGNQNSAKELENYLELLYGRPALLFNSGYHLNSGVLPALAKAGSFTIVSDKLIHASIIDGIRLSARPFERFRHNDTTQLRHILKKLRERGETAIIVTESIFSMDGDIAPLREIVELKREFENVLLYVDEAHAVGAYGKAGLGVCAELGLLEEVDFLVGTFGKAVASMGAFIVCSPVAKQFLINHARSLIFSTSLPPACHQHTLSMLHYIVEQGAERRRHLAHISELFRRGIEKITGRPTPSSTYIVPLIVGDPERAVTISRKLKERGIKALPIRVPTVPAGTERIRFSLNGALTVEDVEHILRIIEEVYEEGMA